MDLPDLAVLVAVADTGSMTGASRRLHLALAAVSARVKALEAELGAELVVREARGVRLTPAGEIAVRHARLVTEGVERMRRELRGEGEVRGRVRIWASTMAVAEHLPPVLGRILARWPALDLEVEEHPSLQVLEALDDGRADIGVVSGVRIPRGWMERPFREDRLVLLAPAGHPLAALPEVGLDDVLEAAFVGLEAGSGIQRYLEGLAERGGHRLRVVVRVRSFDAIGQLVSVGAGVAILPASTVARLTPPGTVAVPLRDDWAVRDLRVCAPDGPRSAAVEVTLDGLR